MNYKRRRRKLLADLERMLEVLMAFSPPVERRHITIFATNPTPYREVLNELPIITEARRHGIRVSVRIITKDNTDIKEDHIHYPLEGCSGDVGQL